MISKARFGHFRSLAAAIAILACSSGFALAQSGDAGDRLGVPGPISFGGTEYALAWSAQPSAGYFKQEYLPQGEDLQSYAHMFIVEAVTSGVSLEDAVAAQVGMLNQRKANDPIVNYDVIRNDRTGEIILDFVLSGNSDGTLIIEWNAYRYTEIEGGVGLFAISRRGYGDEARDFLSGLAQWRADTMNALAQFETPVLSPRE